MENSENLNESKDYKKELQEIKNDISGLRIGIDGIRNTLNSILNIKHEAINNSNNNNNDIDIDIDDNNDNTEKDSEKDSNDDSTEINFCETENVQLNELKEFSDSSYNSKIKFILDELKLINYDSLAIPKKIGIYSEGNDLYDSLYKYYNTMRILYNELICLHCEQEDLLRVIKAYYYYYSNYDKEIINKIIKIHTDNSEKINGITEKMKTYYDKIRNIIHNMNSNLNMSFSRKKKDLNISQDLLKLKNISKDIDTLYFVNNFNNFIDIVLYQLNIFRLINVSPNISYLFKEGKTFRNFTIREIKNDSFKSLVEDLQYKYENQIYKYEFIPNHPKAFYLNKN